MFAVDVNITSLTFWYKSPKYSFVGKETFLQTTQVHFNQGLLYGIITDDAISQWKLVE